jgi:CubicO group peptidase (beta-lactamase class C family)
MLLVVTHTFNVFSQRILQVKKQETMSLKLSQICRKYSLLLGFLLFFQFVYSQYNFAELDKQIAEHAKMLGGNMVTLIYKDNKIVYEKKVGDFDKRTIIPIASCSKWFTAAMVMTLVDEGKISLDDKVSKYIPLFDAYRKSYITIRHCLSHQTGIQQDAPTVLNLLDRKKFVSLEEEVNSFAKKDIDFNPGTGFYYGGVGLNIAARICEIVTRKNFNQLMLERIFRPLGMRTTTFQNENFSLPPNPSGGAKSCAEEYMNFLTMILNNGVYKDKRILSEAAIKEMQTEQISIDKIKYIPKVADGATYGLGEWIMEKDANNVGTVISSPGLFGSWPMIDKCRGYAVVFFVKTLINESKRNIYDDIKSSIDNCIPKTKCN